MDDSTAVKENKNIAVLLFCQRGSVLLHNEKCYTSILMLLAYEQAVGGM